MQFKKYNSIENSYQSEFIKAIYENGYGELEYIVQEKVHGANVSYITNGDEVVSAKRTGLIDDNEDFYNSHSIKKQYEQKIKSLYEYLSNTRDINTLTVFGEIFGGGYPHKDVPIIENAKLIQHGIYYNPNNDFYAFDIMINNEEYLDVETTDALFVKFNFIYAKTLFKGNLKECLGYSNNFKTTIPKYYELPELEGNICEGVVIRPIKPVFLKNGSRLIIKNKNEIWAENNNYIDKETLTKLLRQDVGLNKEVENLCEEVYKYISINRLSNVISKVGEINPKKDLGKILGMFNKDILTDFYKENKEEFDLLDKPERKVINKFVNKHANIVVNTYFLNGS